MTIKFPRVHIATSVVNKILNVADGLKPAAPTAELPPPVVPDAQIEGEALDVALAAPTPPLPPIDEAPNPGATIAGAPLLSTLLKPTP